MQRAWCATALALAMVVLADLKVSTTNVATELVVVPTLRSAGSARSAALDPAIKAAGELPRLHSLLVSHRGSIILERYFNGRRETTPANVKSVSKSVVSALVGIAADRKLLVLDRTIGTYFPDLPEVKRGIYSTGNTHILSAILTRATGKSTWQFAQEALAKPLGFSLQQWARDPQGVYFGGNDMLMTPRQMLTFGEMYRNGGLLNGRQILSKDFIDDTFEPRGRSRISGREYGYGWWMREMDGRQAYYAWGFGGQYIVLVPSLELTVVSTSAATVGEDRRDHRRTVEDIIEQFVVAAVGS